MSQQNGWMSHSISTCASCKQIPFIYTRHTPGFFRMFCWWLVMEFQNPAPEAGRLLKTAQTLDKQTHPCGGSPPAPAADRSQELQPPAGPGEAPLPPPPAGIPQLSPAASPTLPWDLPQGTFALGQSPCSSTEAL